MTKSSAIVSPSYIGVTPAMAKFFDLLNEIKPGTFSATTDLMQPAYFHGGPVGPLGCSHPPESCSEDCFDETLKILVIKFEINSEDKEAFMTLNKELKLTSGIEGKGKPYTAVTINSPTHEVKKMVCGKPGFEEAFLATRNLIPNLKVMEFAKWGLVNPKENEFNLALAVVRDYIPLDHFRSGNCEMIYISDCNGRYALIGEYSVKEPLAGSKSQVTLRILSSDIETNTPVLLRYLIKYT